MNDAELAVLSIIAEAPISGDELRSAIDQRNLRAWTQIGVQSISYVLDQLQQRDLIELLQGEDSSGHKQQRYRITQAGLGLLHTAVAEMLSSPRRSLHSFELGLANLPVLQTDHTRHALYTYRVTLQQHYQNLSRQQQELNELLPFHIHSMYQHQLTLLSAEMAWFDDWIEQWEAQLPPSPESASPDLELQEATARMKQLILPHNPDSFHKLTTELHSDGEDMPPPPQRRQHPENENNRATQLNQATPFTKGQGKKKDFS